MLLLIVNDCPGGRGLTEAPQRVWSLGFVRIGVHIPALECTSLSSRSRALGAALWEVLMNQDNLYSGADLSPHSSITEDSWENAYSALSLKFPHLVKNINVFAKGAL